eukprot:36963-Pyramimonas_sp.AAC.1
MPSCLGAAVCALMAVVSAWALLRLPDVRGPWCSCEATAGPVRRFSVLFQGCRRWPELRDMLR